MMLQLPYCIVHLWSSPLHQNNIIFFLCLSNISLSHTGELVLGVTLHKNGLRYSWCYQLRALWYLKFIFKTLYNYWLHHLQDLFTHCQKFVSCIFIHLTFLHVVSISSELMMAAKSSWNVT